MKIPSQHSWSKAFSTCMPHLVVVGTFLVTGSVAYFKPASSAPPILCSVLFSVVPPALDPVIYCLRNEVTQSTLCKIPRNMSHGPTERQLWLEWVSMLPFLFLPLLSVVVIPSLRSTHPKDFSADLGLSFSVESKSFPELLHSTALCYRKQDGFSLYLWCILYLSHPSIYVRTVYSSHSCYTFIFPDFLCVLLIFFF